MSVFQNVLNVLFPKLCNCCDIILGDNEAVVCTKCRHELPTTEFHFTNNEAILKVLYGRAKVEAGTALLRYTKKGIVQTLIHNLKYKKQDYIGDFLGAWLGEELKNIAHYKTIDVVIPVPLHPKTLRKRGYNQVENFAKQLAKALDAEYIDDVLVKTTDAKTQVFKTRLARWQQRNEAFNVKNTEQIKGKHILLVDDIITTGATLEACSNKLFEAENVKISIATMAIAE